MLTVLTAFLLVLQADASPIPSTAQPVASATLHNLVIGRMVRTTDGRRVGEIMRIDRDGAGKPRGAVAIFGSGTVTIPADTLSDHDRGVETSLSYKEVQALAPR